MTEQTTDQPPPPPASATRTPRVRRRATDRVAAGVAGGLGDYLDIDPLLIRAVLVGLVLFNGAGFFIYLAAWLFIPVEGSDRSVVEDWIERLGLTGGGASTAVLILLGVAATLVIAGILGSMGRRLGSASWFGFALVVMSLGVLLFHRTTANRSASGPGEGSSREPSTATPSSGPYVYQRATPRRRERSPLGMYILGLLLVVVGTMAAIDAASPDSILARGYAGAALGILGLGLLVGSWYGRARWLALVGIFVAPFALAASLVTVPLEGEWGAHRATPTTVAELRDSYRVAGGRLTLDLTDLQPSPGERRIAANVTFGRLLVILPEGARADVTSAVDAGTSSLFDVRRQGTAVTDRYVREGTGTSFVLDLKAGLGEVRVITASAGD